MDLANIVVGIGIFLIVMWGFSRSKNEIIRIPGWTRRYYQHKHVVIPAKDRDPSEYPPYYRKRVVIPKQDED